MNFKKGDIVKVIKEDYFGDKVYHVGSVWEVVGTPSRSGLVMIKDSRQSSGNAVLFKDRVEIIKRFEPLFKVGDMVKVKSSTYIDDPSLGNIYRVEDVVNGLTRGEGVVYLDTGVNDDYTKLWVYWFNEVELVNDNSDMELVDIIQDKNIKIKQLEKLNEGLINNNRIIADYNDHLLEENNDLRNQNRELRGKRVMLSQRVRKLTEENEILKDDLERKKFFRNFLTRKKD